MVPVQHIFALQKRHLITVVSFWTFVRRRFKPLDINVLSLFFLPKTKQVCINVEHALSLQRNACFYTAGTVVLLRLMEMSLVLKVLVNKEKYWIH